MIKVMVEEIISDGRLKYAERKLLKQSLLKLQDLEDKKVTKKKPRDGLKFLINQMFSKNTVYASNGKIQCFYNRRRSQGDLFLIMQYYYPTITFKEFRSLLFSLVNKEDKLNATYCGTISKRVFWKDGLRNPCFTGVIWSEYMKDEFGFTLI
jgi:hypothetical protein